MSERPAEDEAWRDKGLRRRIEALCDEQATWKPYESRDTGDVFLADSVRDFIDDLRAALADTVPDQAEHAPVCTAVTPRT